ncbi:MAG: hypothetical protein GY856_53355 [bacterium]|nr:hypothetical protein [bacterium]
MATLHVRNVPADLHERLSRHAQAQRRSLSAEVIMLLTRALDGAERTPEQILAAIKERCRFTPAAVGAPDSTTLLREDRDR